MTTPETAKILIVDDDPINVRVLEMTLSDDYETIAAYNGHDAIKLIKEGSPDLVLLDVMMAGMNGFEVCSIIKSDEAYASIPIIFVTALTKTMDESKGLSLGAVDYILKPINTDIVKLRVKNQIELKFQRDLLKKQRDTMELQRNELEDTISRIKKLEGIISICMYCKKIRNEKESWEQMEKYITEHSDAHFSHGICPDCYEEFKKNNGLDELNLKTVVK